VALLVPAVRLLPPHEETDLLPLAEHDADDVRGLFFPPASPTPAVPRAGPSSIVAGVNDAPILD
jgi:hypothetical protein